MKYKITKVEANGETYYEAHVKKRWFLPWQQIKFFYKSPFKEMPGWWSGCFINEREAMIGVTIAMTKLMVGGSTVRKTIVSQT